MLIQTLLPGTSSSTRCRISPAALLVKVMARMFHGSHALLKQVGDAAGDDPRFAAAGPGQDQERPFAVRYRRPLIVG